MWLSSHKTVYKTDGWAELAHGLISLTSDVDSKVNSPLNLDGLNVIKKTHIKKNLIHRQQTGDNHREKGLGEVREDKGGRNDDGRILDFTYFTYSNYTEWPFIK